MRSCLLCLILATLVAANGYAIWQIHLIRANLEALGREVRRSEEERHRVSMLDYARDAAEAIGRGELERAEADLERLGELLEETRQIAESHRQRLIGQLEAAKEAMARGGERAREEVDDLIRMLSQKTETEEPGE